MYSVFCDWKPISLLAFSQHTCKTILQEDINNKTKNDILSFSGEGLLQVWESEKKLSIHQFDLNSEEEKE